MAPGRARRPGVGVPRIEEETPAELEACPFCEGREGRTPPETLALPARRPADSPGWMVRVVPNLYPAFERQEVVIHSRGHVRSLADVTDDELSLVAEAWRRRVAAAREAGFRYVHACINEGRAAGASLAHSHSQLVWMADEPPAVTRERHDTCQVCAVLAGAPRVLESEALAAVCPPAGRTPYELLIAPREHAGDAFGGVALEQAMRVLRAVIERLRAVEGPVPWNAWLHGGAHWHLEVVPRLTIFAGVELGAEIYVNTLAAEDAAAALRAAG